MSKTVRQVALSTCFGALALMATQPAFGSAFGLHEQSADGIGNAFAGATAEAHDASTLFSNPAGMSLLDSSEINTSATWISPDVRFTGSNSNPLYAAGIGGPTVNGVLGGNDIKPAAIGSTYIVYKINSDFSAGVAIDVPFGQRSEYRDNWVGRYQALASDLTDYEIALLMSYKVNDHLSIGGGPRIDYFDGRLTNALNVSAIGLNVAQGLGNGARQYLVGAQAASSGAMQAQAGAQAAAAAGNLSLAAQLGAQATALAAQAKAAAAQAQALAAQAGGMQTLALGWAAAGSDGLAKVTGHDSSVGYNVGALYVIDPQTRVGFDYRSKMFHNLSGNQQIQLPGNASQAPAAFQGLFVNQPAKLKVTLPDSASMGIYHDITPEWAVMFNLEWTEWSTIKQLNVIGTSNGQVTTTQENWRNTWFGAVGLNWKPVDRWTFHFGTAYDEGAVTDATRTARLPDMSRYWAALGASFKATKAMTVNMGYAHLFTPGGNITDSSGAAQGGGTLTGSYRNSVDIISLGAGLRF